MHRYLLHNNQIHTTEQALLSPGQVGFMNGWGVFSTIRVAEGVLFAFERHYLRMKRDAERMRVPFDISRENLKRLLLNLIHANDAENATLRVAVIRNRGGLFEAPGLQRDADLVAFTADLQNWPRGAKLSYMRNARHAASPFAGTKYTSWAQNLTWYELAHERGLDEFILLNEFGQISECTSANVFAIRGDSILTPPLETSGCLAGVTRAILLEEFHIPGFEIREQDMTPSDLEKSDAVFITSTTRDLLPAIEIDGERLEQSTPTLSLLQQGFQDYRANYVLNHKLVPTGFAV